MSRQSAVESFVAQPALALVGLSRTGKKFGNLAYRELSARGYRVYPVHPDAPEIGGVKCFAHFSDLPEPVDAALVVVPAPRVVGVMQEAAAAGVRQVWLQQGAESPEAAAAAEALGIELVAGECVLMYARPKGVHKLHHWIWRLLGKLPPA